jgi:hypothetical protein
MPRAFSAYLNSASCYMVGEAYNYLVKRGRSNDWERAVSSDLITSIAVSPIASTVKFSNMTDSVITLGSDRVVLYKDTHPMHIQTSNERSLLHTEVPCKIFTPPLLLMISGLN